MTSVAGQSPDLGVHRPSALQLFHATSLVMAESEAEAARSRPPHRWNPLINPSHCKPALVEE